ncbi:NACHT domain-containing protein, partial [Mycena sp. CBHHK59/15]
GASHDSGERFLPPRCHPETRMKMLQKLRDWSSQTDASSRVLWLHGPAGAGKSAIAQTLSQQLEADRCLGASFFFKRGDSSRGNARGLFPTISYQLATVLPKFQSTVSQQVEKDPSVVNKTLALQLNTLVVEPFKAITYRGSPFILIIDGLDECNSQEIQQEILWLLGNSLREHSPPFRILIASRPEPHIRKIFEGPCFSGLYCPSNVEQSFQDVRRYLWAQFSRIHKHHDAMAAVPSPWPTAEVLEKLVCKSSGYFIYVSTVFKY